LKISDLNLLIGDLRPRVIFNMGEHPNEIEIAPNDIQYFLQEQSKMKAGSEYFVFSSK